MIDIKQLERLNFSGKRVTIVGLGIEGVDFARFLTRRGAIVTASDTRSATDLSARLSEVADLPLALRLGPDQAAAVTGADAVFASQSVPMDSPALTFARDRGIPVYSTVQLFLELAPGPVVGITGSSGKTTTTALVAEMFRADERPTFVGGNIGIGLLDHLDSLRPYSWSVLEISHTQLQAGEISPHIAAVINITPNHLDRFAWDEYRQLKANLVRYQGPTDIAVLNHDDPEVRALEALVKGRLVWYTMTGDLEGEGVFVKDGWAYFRSGEGDSPLFALDWLTLRGRHNQQNAVAAAAIAMAAGVSPDAIVCAIEAFRAVPHRLEHVGEIDEVTYVNDSIATTPERTVAGLRSYDEPVVLLLGGRDKQLPFDELAVEAMARCRAIILFGESADKLAAGLSSVPNNREITVMKAAGLVDAMVNARRLAQPGDVVLLAPACTSYDAYDNFERRGEHFRSLVEGLARESSGQGKEGIHRASSR